MNFLSIPYSLFLFGTMLLFWNLPWKGLRLALTLTASVIFYSSLQLQSLPLLLVGTLFTFVIGSVLFRTGQDRPHRSSWTLSNDEWERFEQQWQQRRQWLLIFGLVVNVTILVAFKYGPFLFPDWTSNTDPNSIWAYFIAPLGISFFVFECMAYLIDVYRGAPASQNVLDFTAYKFFFPKLISGPITRYHPWMEQFHHPAPPTVDRVVEGLWLIASGAIKKGLLADNIAVFVNLCFENYQRVGSVDLWLAILGYGLQLYLDFSGYVDIARGSAMLLGWTLPLNFDFPYLTVSIADFWRRWHMTLGEWLRNYLYFPLGGSRRGLNQTCINLTIVMILAGLWHGSASAGQNPAGFLVWGVLHGLALVVHRLTDTVSRQSAIAQAFWESWPGVLIGWAITQTMVFLAWVYFRLPDLQVSNWVMTHLWNHSADTQFIDKVYGETLGLDPVMVAWGFGAIGVGMVVAYGFDRSLKVQLNWPIKIMLVPLCLYAVWVLAPQNSLPYIYFDF